MPLRLLALAAVLLLAGCDGPILDSVDLTDAPPDQGPGATEPGGTNGDGAGEGTEAPGQTPVDDRGGVGANGPAMLRDDRSQVVLEVDIQEGARVDDDALAHLVALIEQYSGKQVVRDGGNTFASDHRDWTTDDLRAAAGENRSTASSSDAVAIHVLYVRGGLVEGGEDANAIGVAYGAAHAAVFPDQWAGLGGVVGSEEAIERAVLVHEWGHLLGLVNITYTSSIDHEDPEHPHHSTNEDSVMFWKVETDLIGQLLGSIPDDFDDADRADMQQIAEGG
jgi:hypothetical protein